MDPLCSCSSSLWGTWGTPWCHGHVPKAGTGVTAPEAALVPARCRSWSGDRTFHPSQHRGAPGLCLEQVRGCLSPAGFPPWAPQTPQNPAAASCTPWKRKSGTSSHWVTQPASGGLGNRPVPIDLGTVVAPGSPGVSSGARPHRGHAAVTPFALVLAWPAGRNRGLTHRGWAPPVPPSFRRSLGLAVRPRPGSARPNGDHGHGLPLVPFSPPRRSGAARAVGVWLKEEEPGSRAVPVSKISLFLGGSVAMSHPQPPRAEIKEQRAPGRAAPGGQRLPWWLAGCGARPAASVGISGPSLVPRAGNSRRRWPAASFVGEVLAEARETEPRGEGMAALHLP